MCSITEDNCLNKNKSKSNFYNRVRYYTNRDRKNVYLQYEGYLSYIVYGANVSVNM